MFHSCTTALPLSKCSSPALLLPDSYFTYISVDLYAPALLLLYYYLTCCVCIYICFTPALLRLDLYMYNIYNVGIYSCL
jgi:hypothetical protein